MWFDRVDRVVGHELGGVTGGVSGLATTVIAQPQGMIGWSIPDQVAADGQAVVAVGGAGNVGGGTRRARAVDRQVLPLALVAGGVVDQVVVDIDFAIGNRLAAITNGGRPPAAGREIGRTLAGQVAVPITTAPAKAKLEQMAALSYSVEGVVGEQNLIAAAHP